MRVAFRRRSTAACLAHGILTALERRSPARQWCNLLLQAQIFMLDFQAARW